MTIVLDAAWQPINIISAERAFAMVYSERARAIEFYSQKPCALFYYPSVVICRAYVRKRFISLYPTRANILWRDKYSCQYCTKKGNYRSLTLDHIIPKSRGGDKGWLNLVTCCARCNQKKGSKTPSEAFMSLIREPHVPKFNVMRVFGFKKTPEPWKKYLGEKNE